MPSVSIIIPAKNRPAELAAALASLRAQTCDDWEAVVVDDASTQDIAAVVAEQAQDHIRYVKLPPDRAGAPAGRNYGFEVTTGKFVLFFDSDDHLAPHAIEQRLGFLQARPELDFAVWGCRQFRHTPGDLPLLWNQLIKPGIDDLDRYVCRDTPWQSASPLWRRSFLGRVGGWDEDALSGQDWEFPLRALLLRPRYEKVATVDHYWRIAAANRPSIGKSAGIDKNYTRSWARTVLRICDHFEADGRLQGPGSQITRERLGVVVWEAALRLGDRVSARDGRKVWREARRRGLVGVNRFWQGWSLLALRRSTRLQRRLRHRLMLSWPRPYFFPQSATFNKVRAPDAPPPRVSVVMAVDNSATTVDEAVRSLARQSFRDLEILICDAGSTDGTAPLLQRHADGDCRIRIIPQDPSTPRSPWPALAAAARGELIAPMGDNDLAHPERIGREAAWLDAHPDAVVVGSQCRNVDIFGVDLPYEQTPADHDDIDAALLQGSEHVLHHNACMFRRSAYEQVGGYRAEFEPAEPLDLLLRLTEAGRAANLPDILMRHWIASEPSPHPTRYAQARARVLELVRERRGLPGTGAGVTRDGSDSLSGQVLQWGWHALEHGRKDAARGHSLSALRRRPLSRGAWHLFFCAMRGY